MAERMAKLDRILALIYALSETSDGLTLDEMAERLGVTRRTAERMRDIIGRHFDLEEMLDDRHKRFLIRDSLRRAYTRPSAAEVAALQAEVDGHASRGQEPRAGPLRSLLGKVRSALDGRERRRLEPDLEALVRLQRAFVAAGPSVNVEPASLVAVQNAILSGLCVEFEYTADGRTSPQWRRVVPFGLVHGAVTYLLGKLPGREDPPVYYRLDRMNAARLSDAAGFAPEDFDLDDWIAESFGIWREDGQEIVLEVLPSGQAKAISWRFHPHQQIEDLPSGGLLVSFRSSGLRELADHLFTWGGEIIIREPEALRTVMRERLLSATKSLGDPDTC